MSELDRILEQIKIRFDSDIAFEEAADLKRKTVDNWKRGRSQSYLKMIPKLCEIFDVNADYILGTEKPTDLDGDPPASQDDIEIARRIAGLNLEKRARILGYLDSLEHQDT